jgi:hypothetical protein
MDRRCTGLVLAMVAFAGGCLSQVFPPAKVCPGKPNVAEALAAIKTQGEALEPFRANGQCRLGYVVESGKTRQFNLPVSVYINPPSEVYLQGQAAPGPRGLVFLGTNEREFWLGIWPDISTFWWGRWATATAAHDLPVSPEAVFESLGLATVSPLETDPNRWALSAKSGQDVLTWRDPDGQPLKRLFVERCDYRIARIEYLDRDGHVSVMVELKKYEKVGKAMWVPSRISIVAYANGERTHWAKLSLDTFMERKYKEEFRQRYFVRPEPRGFENVIEVDGTAGEK